jgi:hypothetical protein
MLVIGSTAVLIQKNFIRFIQELGLAAEIRTAGASLVHPTKVGRP